jgi:hypothetical protein
VNSIPSNLESLKHQLNALLSGQKLRLDPAQVNDARIIRLLENMYPLEAERYAERDLDVPSKLYYIMPEQEESTTASSILKIDTQVHPLCFDANTEQFNFKKGCIENNITNVVVMGMDLHFRPRQYRDQAAKRADNLVLHHRGDLVALSQTVNALIDIVTAGNPNKIKSLTISNANGRFTPVLEMLGIDSASSRDFKIGECSIKIVQNADNLIAAMRAHGENLNLPIEPLPALFEATAFATTSDEKLDDDKRVKNHARLDYLSLHSDDVGGHSRNANEFTGSPGGNALDKVRATLEEKSNAAELIQTNGLPGKTFLKVADGAECMLDARIRFTRDMRDGNRLVHRFSEFPGAETKPISARIGGSKEGYYSAMQKAMHEIGPDADRRVIDTCVAIVAPLVGNDPKDPVYYAVKAQTPLELVFTPRPDHKIKSQRHFQKPLNRDETIAELEIAGDPWIARELAIAKAMRVLGAAAAIPKRAPDLQEKFDAARKMRIAVGRNFSKNEPLAKDMRNNGLHLDRMNREIRSFDDIRTLLNNGGGVNRGYAFVGGKTGKGHNFFLSDLCAPSSLFVAKQLRDPRVNGNPGVILDPDDTRYGAFKTIIRSLSDNGNIPQDVHRIIKFAKTAEEAAKYIRERAIHEEGFAPELDIKEQKLCVEDRDMVTFFLSASCALPYVQDDAYSGAINWGMNGYGGMSGFGEAFPMGWNVWGYLALIKQGLDVPLQGVQDPYAMKTEGWPIGPMEQIAGPGNAVVARDILYRLEMLLELEKYRAQPQRKKLVTVHSAGAGGLQEISGALGLKVEGERGLENAHFFIRNTPRTLQTGVVVRDNDALLNEISKRYNLDELGIHPCENQKDEMRIASEIVGRKLEFYDVKRPYDTDYPFVESKNPYADWLLDQHIEADFDMNLPEPDFGF